MTELQKGHVYYYFIYYKDSDEYGICSILSHKTSSGLMNTFTILQIISRAWMGHEQRIKIGGEISPNELQGVGVSGVGRYIFDKYEVIRKLFTVAG